MMREDNGTIVVPLLAEDVSITKQQLITGRVTVSTLSHQHEHLVDELLVGESVEIDRVPVGQIVERAPQVRQDGDTLIIPVMEEVLVLERRLMLKEEVRVRRVRTTRGHRERVQLRRQEAFITRQSRENGTKKTAVRNTAAEIEEQPS
jgi:stress response protein YsnF